MCEICREEFTSLDTHHIQSKCHGGSNEKYNLTKICPNCHRAVHCGDIILEGKFASSSGTVLVWHKKGEDSVTGYEPPVYII